ncbi:MAG: GDSL-type esterase/lipase family protein [Candidatus Gracilibacteria bacterium]|nr:GDSL-type esterase/lipase family protein [Candidatus Gracilibacteria bacterium]
MKFFAVFLLIFLVFVGFEILQTRKLITIGVGLAESAVPFERLLPDAELQILVIGDSTAVGTGAQSSEASLAGLVGKKFPQASIRNLGVNGARTVELIARLEQIQDQHFDIILLHIGGNDTVYHTDLKELEKSITTVLDLSLKMADRVVLTSTGNVGTALLLPFGTRSQFERRTRQVRAIFKPAAESRGIHYSDLMREGSEDPYAKEPLKYYAADLFHPSDIGYQDWFAFIEPGLEGIVKK